MASITTEINLALTALKNNNLVAVPTETVYGLAANAYSHAAVKKIYQLKKRPRGHPLIMHVAPDWPLLEWVEKIPYYAEQLINKFWPGPLTLIFEARLKSDICFETKQKTIAIRCPNHPMILELLNKFQQPLVAPSANPFGRVSPTTALHVAENFTDDELLILDGGRCSGGIESTIISALEPNDYQIVRHGLIDPEKLNAVYPLNCKKPNLDLAAPGTLLFHYQPKKPLFYFDNLEQLRKINILPSEIYLLSFNEKIDVDFYHFYQFLDPIQTSYEFYYQILKADKSCAKYIAVELPTYAPAWLSIRERIFKAGKPISDLMMQKFLPV